MLRVLLILAILVLTPLAGFVGYLFFNQARLILPATVNAVKIPSPEELPYNVIALEMPDGTRLHGILLPAGVPSPTLILAFPGNTHDATGFAAYLKQEIFPEREFAVAAFSYRGYPNALGKPSEGSASQKTMYADAEEIYEALKKQVQPGSISIVGYSIGTTVSVHLALARPVERMVLLAPLASVRRMAQENYPWLPVRYLLRNPFATEDIISDLKVSTTIIYTPTDGLVPIYHVTEVLHRANPSIPQIPLEGVEHTTLLSHPQAAHHIREGIKPAE